MTPLVVLFGGCAVAAFISGVYNLATSGPALSTNVTTFNLVLAAVVMAPSILGAAVSRSPIPRLSNRGAFSVASLFVFVVLTNGWATDFLGAWGLVMFAWGNWRDGDSSKRKTAADRFLRRLLDKIRLGTRANLPAGGT